MRVWVWICAAVAVVALSRDARADDHTVYVEAFGRGGLYGIGYDYQLTLRLSVGATVSAYRLYGQTVVTAAPYLGLYLLRGQRHGWFAQAGPQLAVVSADSPIAGWDGERRAGLGGELTSGWEYRDRVVIRTFATLTAGKGGVAPWAGASIGLEF